MSQGGKISQSSFDCDFVFHNQQTITDIMDTILKMLVGERAS